MKKLVPLLLIVTLIVLLLALFPNKDTLDNITDYVLLGLDQKAFEKNSLQDKIKRRTN